MKYLLCQYSSVCVVAKDLRNYKDKNEKKEKKKEAE